MVPEPVAPEGRKAWRKLQASIRWVRAAVYAGRLDDAWASFERAICRWHAAAATGGPRVPSHGSVEWAAPAARGRRDGDEDAAVWRTRERLESLQYVFNALAREAPEAAVADQVLAAAAAAEPEGPDWRFALAGADYQALPGLLHAAKEEHAAAAADRRDRHARWYEFCTDRWLTKQRDIYGWVRRDPLPPAVAEGDLPPPGTHADLARLEGYWQGLWRHDPGPLDLDDGSPPCRTLARWSPSRS